MSAQVIDESVCCPKFEPEPWQDKILEWKDKKFITTRVFTLLYMPVGFGNTMRKLDRAMRQTGAESPDRLCLSDHTSQWNMNLYLATDMDIQGYNTAIMSGRYYSRVYEGSFKDTGKWCKDFEESAKSKGYSPGKLFMWYTTCPKCAKKYGKNYVVILSRVS